MPILLNKYPRLLSCLALAISLQAICVFPGLQKAQAQTEQTRLEILLQQLQDSDETGTRFTGTVRVKLEPDGQPPINLDVSILHGRVQTPQSVLRDLLTVGHEQKVKLRVELVVSTNSTPPLLLQIRAGQKPVSAGEQT